MTRFADCCLDKDIVNRARFGDSAANEAVYRTFSTAVYNLALRLTRQRQVADEILQETFIEVLTKIGSFRGEAPIGAWIREIAVNKCLMHFRSGWHRKSRSITTPELDEDGIHTDLNSDHLDLEKAMDSLSPVSRMVVWLHDVEGYTHQEIGNLMGKTNSFSKSQLARAHKHLRSLLEDSNKSEQPCMQLSNNY